MYSYNPTVSKQRKVVVYARVSTEHEAQLNALENQKDWYKPILQQHSEWELVRMYVDEGITGTSAKKRPQFMQMIQDAEKGQFDLILTREVSRFARNTVDTLQFTRSLKSKGVEVFFINDNIKTFDGDGELRLTIMATLAQDESRKTSIRVKAGQQTSMVNGVLYGNGNILGYDRVGKDLIINPEQAETVRKIFRWYLDGLGLRAIQINLEKEGRLTATGKKNWYCANISKVLQNSFYCGIITYHKQFTPDFLEQKRIHNFGDIEQVIVKGTHEPIITEDEFNQVQQILNSKRETLVNNESGKRRQHGAKTPINVWTDLLECECGHKFNRKVWQRKPSGIQYAYQCYSSVRTGTVSSRLKKGLPIEGVCKTPMIPEWKLQFMAKYVFKKFVDSSDEVINLAMSMLEKHIDDKEEIEDNTELILQKEKLIEKLSNRLENFMEMRADGEITKEEYQKKKSEIKEQLETLRNELAELKGNSTVDDDNDFDYQKTILYLRQCLTELVEVKDDEDLPDNVIKAFVRKIIVTEDTFEWYLRLSPDDTPQTISLEGNRKTNAKVSSRCYKQDRLLLTISNLIFVKF